jgi:hypothetical protein
MNMVLLIYFLLSIVATGILVIIIAMGVNHIVQEWARRHPFCDKCGTRGRDVEPIFLGNMHTSYVLCADCRSDNTMRYYRGYRWACVLYDLHRAAKDLRVYNLDTAENEAYDIHTEQYWPKDDNERPLTLDEIMMLVLEDS